MHGPYAFTYAVVERISSVPGAYILGSANGQALYVGRSDTDIRSRLLMHLAPSQHMVHFGNVSRGVYGGLEQFWFQYASYMYEAYYLECQWYHQFSPMHNQVHPVRPFGGAVRCPVCGQ